VYQENLSSPCLDLRESDFRQLSTLLRWEWGSSEVVGCMHEAISSNAIPTYVG